MVRHIQSLTDTTESGFTEQNGRKIGAVCYRPPTCGEKVNPPSPFRRFVCILKNARTAFWISLSLYHFLSLFTFWIGNGWSQTPAAVLNSNLAEVDWITTGNSALANLTQSMFINTNVSSLDKDKSLLWNGLARELSVVCLLCVPLETLWTCTRDETIFVRLSMYVVCYVAKFFCHYPYKSGSSLRFFC